MYYKHLKNSWTVSGNRLQVHGKTRRDATLDLVGEARNLAQDSWLHPTFVVCISP